MRRERRRARGEHLGLAQAERRAHLAQHELVGKLELQRVERARRALRVLRLGHAGAHGERPLGQLLLGALAAAHLRQHAFHHLLPEPRHAEQQRGLHLGELARDVLELRAEVDGVALGKAGPDALQLLGDVTEREEREHRAPRKRQVPVLHGHVGRVSQVVVRQHGPLGVARRTRGVDKERAGPGVDLREVVGERLRARLPRERAALGEGLFVRDRLGRDRCVAIEDEDPRHAVRDGILALLSGDLLKVLLVLHREQRRLGVVQDVLDVFRGGVRVEARRLAPDEQRRQVDVDPLRAVVREDRADLARVEALGLQEQRDVVNPVTVLTRGQRLPLALRFEALGRRVRRFVSPLFQTVEDGAHCISCGSKPRGVAGWPGCGSRRGIVNQRRGGLCEGRAARGTRQAAARLVPRAARHTRPGRRGSAWPPRAAA